MEDNTCYAGPPYIDHLHAYVIFILILIYTPSFSINADLIVVVASVVVLSVGSKGQVFATSAVR